MAHLASNCHDSVCAFHVVHLASNCHDSVCYSCGLFSVKLSYIVCVCIHVVHLVSNCHEGACVLLVWFI